MNIKLTKMIMQSNSEMPLQILFLLSKPYPPIRARSMACKPILYALVVLIQKAFQNGIKWLLKALALWKNSSSLKRNIS
ncbi:unnamed protein product [Blepharisma stoltei]|uniref:Uncharacterized protein n=1 Tax=Blepharisma stoltei TaxID=1481888 RepID=A0AAU9KD65_9CILI|nr:unnamed protein product [Blepharisma stoltei]